MQSGTGMSTSNALNAPSTTLPTFKSVRDQSNRNSGYAESSNDSSSRSAAGRSQTSQARSYEGSETSKRISLADQPQQENVGYHLNGTIRRSKRSSGGFLLDSSPNSSHISRSLLSKKSVKGKEKPEKQNISVPKKRAQLDDHESYSPRRGSPLSSEIRSSPVVHDHASLLHDPQRGTSSHHADSSSRSNASNSSRPNASSYGFDTDPAQIVDMALRLNAGRQRQASMKRFVSSATDARRVVSAATSFPARSSPPRQAVRLYESLRQPTKRKPFDVDPISPQQRTGDLSEDVHTSPMFVGGSSTEQDAANDDEGMQISHATQNRVAKAKQYFELAYEHRRLLSHLPPLRKPDANINPNQPGYGSKAYNPLQYARNRKLRFRERKPIMAEDDGWHDVEKVRIWVDAVVNSHTETEHSPLECVRLPPLTLVDEELQDADHDSDRDRWRAPQPGKPRRPKSDWVTHPGDQIADAFWTEQGLNKQKYTIATTS